MGTEAFAFEQSNFDADYSAIPQTAVQNSDTMLGLGLGCAGCGHVASVHRCHYLVYAEVY